VPPLTTLTEAGLPTVLVSENPGEVVKLPTEAVTVKVPSVALAVAVTWVWPCAFVVVGVVSVALAPLLGVTVNVTVAPDTGLPTESFTTTINGLVKAVLILALCGVPLTTAMDAAEPAVMVTLVLAAVYPGAVAVMVAPPTLVPVTWGCVDGVVAP
jgi:hypothetical protein